MYFPKPLAARNHWEKPEVKKIYDESLWEVRRDSPENKM